MLQQIRDSKKESKGAVQAGFTIIEVMIVLAVAGLIMAIVFLAVPALQRNARNTQRNGDANRVLAAIGECLASKNGQITSCDTLGEITPAYVDTASNQQLTTVAFAAGLAPDTNTLNIRIGAKCNDAGDAPITGTSVSTRSYIAMYKLERSGNSVGVDRCLAS